jgi:pSer/pThr/pTyr-binding forkhead associated (FHA) protein
MAGSIEDEECRTLGLPGGAAREILKGLHLPGIKNRPNGIGGSASAPPALPLVEGGSRRPEALSPDAGVRRKPAVDPMSELDPSALRTIPPAGLGPSAPSPRGERKGPSSPPRQPEERRRVNDTPPPATRPVAGPVSKPARGEAAAPPPPSDNWPDGGGMNTAPLPGQFAGRKGPGTHDAAPKHESVPEDVWGDDGSNPGPAPIEKPILPRRSLLPNVNSGADAQPRSHENDFWGTAEGSIAAAFHASEESGSENLTGQTVGGPRPSVLVSKSILEFYDPKVGNWFDLGEVRRNGQIVGRQTFVNWDANPEGVADQHVRIAYEGNELYLEPLPSLNGVYCKLRANQRVELAPGARFRIGRHVLEYRSVEPTREIPPKRSEDGEIFQACILRPIGFVDLIGPDGRPYLSYPMTRADEPGTRIGRGGADCDIALTGDDWTSARHARLLFVDGKCMLEDLKSTNGTFVTLNERIPLRHGPARRPDAIDVILIGQYLIRVVELMPGAAVEAINTRARF